MARSTFLKEFEEAVKAVKREERRRRPERQAARKADQALAKKTWKFLTPMDFPRHLLAGGTLACLASGDRMGPPCRTEFERELSRLLERPARGAKWSKRYHDAWKIMMRRSAVPYMLCARGLYGLKSVADLEALAAAPPYEDPYEDGPAEDEMSVSMNVFAASAHFAERRRKPGSSALIVFRFPPNKLVSTGGDSESGSLHEAELKARGCWKCVDRIYVMSRTRVGKPVADAERAQYGLSAYVLCGRREQGSARQNRESRKWRLLTALPLSMLPDVKRLGLDYAVTRTPPAGWKWYRVR